MLKSSNKRRPSQKSDRRPLVTVLGGGGALLLLAAGYLWMLGGTTPPRQAAIGGPFTLTATDGATVTDATFHGRYVLVYFGYSNCLDVCPTTLAAVADALDVLGPKAVHVQPVFVTVDPKRDTPDVLRRFTGLFTPRLLGLTGTQDQIRQMQQNYRVSSVTHAGAAGSMGYMVDHSSVLYLIGPDGRYLAPIRADESGAEMASDITRHMS
jgi:protein SCO1/2